jgi:hypothetical protein
LLDNTYECICICIYIHTHTHAFYIYKEKERHWIFMVWEIPNLGMAAQETQQVYRQISGELLLEAHLNKKLVSHPSQQTSCSWWFLSVIPAMLKSQAGESRSQPSPRQMWDPTWKITTKAKRTGNIAQMVEHLLSKCEALSSNPVTVKKNYNHLCSTKIFGLDYFNGQLTGFPASVVSVYSLFFPWK